MDNSEIQKKLKAKAKQGSTVSLRVRTETKKLVLTALSRANKKDFGRRIRPDELIALGQSLVTDAHIKSLQDGSLSNADHLERDFRNYVAKHGPISKDVYLGKRLSGEIAATSSTESLPS